MQSELQVARRLIRENADLFEALLEFERTKRLPKLSRKVRANFTVDAGLLREVRRESAKRGVKMSGIVEEAFRERLREWRQGQS